jgi:putative transcriptional regulator
MDQHQAVEKGQLLLAEPFTQDETFKRAVILLTHHKEDGSVGFILNKPLELKVNDVVTRITDSDYNLYMGGPVSSDNLYYIHTRGDLVDGSVNIGKNIYWGGNFDTIASLIDTQQLKPEHIRFFIGYTGWEPGQLTSEMDKNAWIVSPAASAPVVLHPQPKIMWSTILKNMGGKYSQFANYPENPSLN